MEHVNKFVVLPIILYLDIGQTFKPQGLELDVYIPRRQFNKDPI